MKYEQFERADAEYTAGTFGLHPGVAGVYMEHHADVYCKQCAEDILGEDDFSRVKSENFRHDEHGGVAAVLASEEWDCPGARCGHCGISLDVRVIHYEDVCGEHCPNN